MLALKHIIYSNIYEVLSVGVRFFYCSALYCSVQRCGSVHKYYHILRFGSDKLKHGARKNDLQSI
jgi:hypothetical protein